MSTQNSIELVQPENADLHARLKDVVEKTPMAGRHSYFQLKYFIVNKEPTIQAKLWQCLREMKVRKETLEAIGLEREETLDKIELLKLELERTTQSFGLDTPSNDIHKKEIVINQRQTQRRLRQMEKTLESLAARQKDTEEEAAFFLQAFEDLEKVEKVKSYDDAEAQKEYWSARFSNEMNMKLMLEHRIDAELAKAVLSLPDTAVVKQELCGILTQQQQTIETQRMLQRKQHELHKVQLMEGNG